MPCYRLEKVADVPTEYIKNLITAIRYNIGYYASPQAIFLDLDNARAYVLVDTYEYEMASVDLTNGNVICKAGELLVRQAGISRYDIATILPFYKGGSVNVYVHVYSPPNYLIADYKVDLDNCTYQELYREENVFYTCYNTNPSKQWTMYDVIRDVTWYAGVYNVNNQIKICMRTPQGDQIEFDASNIPTDKLLATWAYALDGNFVAMLDDGTFIYVDHTRADYIESGYLYQGGKLVWMTITRRGIEYWEGDVNSFTSRKVSTNVVCRRNEIKSINEYSNLRALSLVSIGKVGILLMNESDCLVSVMDVDNNVVACAEYDGVDKCGLVSSYFDLTGSTSAYLPLYKWMKDGDLTLGGLLAPSEWSGVYPLT